MLLFNISFQCVTSSNNNGIERYVSPVIFLIWKSNQYILDPIVMLYRTVIYIQLHIYIGPI